MGFYIYNASAGSGKTYTIAREYLRWLLSNFSSSAFRNILAVTFTNKATEEMKTRILSSLNKVATGRDLELERSLCEQLQLSSADLQKRAVKLRSAILHDYSHFAVSTIDKFFQKIVRAFMHEADLLPEFAVELDTERLLDEAIEKLLQDSGHDSQLKQWLDALVEKRIENGQHWDVRKELKEMGKEVFNESFHRLGQEFQEKLKNKKFLSDYVVELRKITGKFEKQMVHYADTALLLLKQQGLSTFDFKYKSTSFANYFNKIKQGAYVPSSRTLDAQNDINKWYGNDAVKNAQIDQVYTDLNACLTGAIAYYEESFIQYNTAFQILRNIYSMGLLADIANNVAEVAIAENVLAISDTLYLLFKLIDENETPFIYEKTGSHYHSFMLDEFQDTSEMQWKSLRPLLENGVSQGGNALAVGDVKQSIYRWRSGDWHILAYQLDKDFSSFGTTHVNLDTNWRSTQTIVQTNNKLFTQLPQLLQARLHNAFDEVGYRNTETPLLTAITDAYKNAIQHTAAKNEKKEGYVSIESIANEEHCSAIEKSLQRLPERTKELVERGYRMSDIAVLVRTNREGQAAADALLKQGIAVISQDSLFIARSPAVQLITSILYKTIYPDDTINNTFIEEYLRNSTLSVTIDKDFIYGLSQQPLIEAFEQIIQKFGLHKSNRETSFIQELHDLILHYSTNETGDIYSFVEWWKENGNKQTLTIDDDQDAVRILTIHKSKGLQFRVVIIPFCSWALEPKTGNLIWVGCNEAPFNMLPYIPLNYTQSLANTYFRTDYFTEKTQAYIDNLNLLYVAFTRAEDELYVFTPQPGNNTYSVGQLLQDVLQKTTFEAGEKRATVTASPEKHKDAGTLHRYPSLPYINNLRLRYRDDNSDKQSGSLRDHGILMHRVFSEIAIADDIDPAVDSLVEQGFIADDKELKNKLKQEIRAAIEQPEVAAWFDGSWQLRTEANILLPDTDGQLKQLRPDRVMMGHGKVVVVDYKFGEKEDPNYEEQLRKYIQCLKNMGYLSVEGYLWYVTRKSIHLVIS
jgi:ATP-dependent exoDNAse (exonuclease V) beta subunit